MAERAEEERRRPPLEEAEEELRRLPEAIAGGTDGCLHLPSRKIARFGCESKIRRVSNALLHSHRQPDITDFYLLQQIKTTSIGFSLGLFIYFSL